MGLFFNFKKTLSPTVLTFSFCCCYIILADLLYERPRGEKEEICKLNLKMMANILIKLSYFTCRLALMYFIWCVGG